VGGDSWKCTRQLSLRKDVCLVCGWEQLDIARRGTEMGSRVYKRLSLLIPQSLCVRYALRTPSFDVIVIGKIGGPHSIHSSGIPDYLCRSSVSVSFMFIGF
jgi:hypothetical protein